MLCRPGSAILPDIASTGGGEGEGCYQCATPSLGFVDAMEWMEEDRVECRDDVFGPNETARVMACRTAMQPT